MAAGRAWEIPTPLRLSPAGGQPRQLCEAAPLTPLFSDLASHYAVDKDKQRFELFAGRHQTQPLSSVMDRACGEDGHHLVSFGHLLLDDVVGVGKGGMIVGE